MRIAVAAAVALAGTIVPVALATSPTPVPPVTLRPLGTATALAAPNTAGTHAALTLTVRMELQCGQAPAGPLLVSFPAGFRVPAHIDRKSTRIGDALPAAVVVSGRVVALTVPRTRGLTCDSIGPGTVTVSLLRSAGITNPARTGLYAIALHVGGTAAVAHLRIR